MIKKLFPMVPNHNGYVEVFGGAGWLLFGKEPSKWEVLNDYDSNLMNFWWIVKNCPEQKSHDVVILMNLYNYSKQSVTLRYIGIMQDDLEKALKNFYL